MILILGGGDIGNAIGKALKAKVIPHKELDVRDYLEVYATIRKYKPDVLINTAAIYGPIGKFAKNDLIHWEDTIKINLLGTVYASGVFIKIMKKGQIINFSGGGASYPRPRFSAYAVSKAAVVRFTETIALEYPNVKACCLAPGFIRTNMTKRVHKNRKSQDIKKVIKAVKYIIKNKVTGKIVYAQDL